MVDQAEEMTEREKLVAEADALTLEQQEHRGWKPITIEQNGKREKALRMQPYVPTAESELRARKIVALRRRAARMEGTR
jgi:hypothetical protein